MRVLFEGTKELIYRIDPDIDVLHQSYGKSDAPFNTGRLKGAVKRRFITREVIPWLKSFDLVIDMRAGDSFTDIYGQTFLAEQSIWSEFVAQAGVPIVYGPMTVGPFNTWTGRLIAKANLS